MNNNSARIKQHSSVSTSLACLSNEKLKQILADAKPMHEGIGGKSALISIDDTFVFVKKIQLTDLEQLPQNFMSTANFFDFLVPALLRRNADVRQAGVELGGASPL